MSNGSGLPASPINLVSGERVCFSHGMPTHRVMQSGDDINVEFGGTWRRYAATIGRQLCIGEPSARMREVYDVCRAACDACIAAIHDGVAAIEPHLAAKKVIADAGLDRHRIHTTGYGIAPGSPPSWGEPLKMYGGTTDVLKAGMVVSIEPPIYIHEERIGARIIDNVQVTENGCEILSTVTRDLIVV
jgi:Xaa-Pro dipeptidase